METNNFKTNEFFKYFDKFIKESNTGKRLQKNQKTLKKSTIEPYVYLRKVLWEFSVKKQFELHIPNIANSTKRKIQSESRYWKDFYKQFTDYLYDDLNCYDNYVGTCIKRLRAFFNYLKKNKSIDVGNFHEDFYIPSEEISIITLHPEQINFLIKNKPFELGLPEYLKRTKDTFVFGCTVALRFSDLFRITQSNIESFNGKKYLAITSQKTDTLTRVLLPEYVLPILEKNKGKQKFIFQKISKNQFNKNIKELISKTGWTDSTIKTRKKRGVAVPVYKDPKLKEEFRFCDLISSHTMRRTAITNMLCLGMPENLVRQISGHAPNSKEFYRYVRLSQKYIDSETEKFHEKLNQKELISN